MRKPGRADRRVRPAMEGLEDRRLLSGGTRLPDGTKINLTQDQLDRLLLQRTNVYPDGSNIPPQDRRLVYRTPTGQTAVVTLYGLGSLRGSTVTDGVLDLVYNYTTNESRINGTVRGGGVAPLRGIRDADVPARSPTATGSNPVDAVVMGQFALVDGGYVNLRGGVNEVTLHSIGRGTQMQLTQGVIPAGRTRTTTGGTVAPTAGGGGTFVTPGEIVTVTGAPGAAVGDIEAIPGVSAAAPSTDPVAPTGLDITLQAVNAGPLGAPPLGAAQFFSYDPALAALVRYDTVTLQPTLRIEVPGLDAGDVAVGLGSVGATNAVVVGAGSAVLAFEADTGRPLGGFTVANLPARGINVPTVDGIGSTPLVTVLVAEGGSAVPIDLAGSLAAGQAVPVGPAYTPTRELTLTGGATGLPGSQLIYAEARAHFDTFQPNRFQVGVVTLTPTFNPATGQVTFRETARNALRTTGGGFIDAGPVDAPFASPSDGLGATGFLLGRLLPGSGDRTSVQLFNVSNYQQSGTVSLAGGGLEGLSETYYANIADGALIDVQGTLRRFVADSARGLILNGRGLVNLVAVNNLSDSTIIGRPINHVSLPIRRNVQLFSTSRGINGLVTRGGVTVLPILPVPGPVGL